MLGEFLDLMHLRQIDLLAHESGIALALALVEQRPTQVGRVVLSPNTEVVRAQQRGLRHPTLIIDLRAADAGNDDAAELEHHAAQLRDFLGLA